LAKHGIRLVFGKGTERGVFHVRECTGITTAQQLLFRQEPTTRQESIVTRHFRVSWIIALVDGTQIIKPPQATCPCCFQFLPP
jgi:hypothetical protein